MGEATKPDPVLQYLVAINMADHEIEFRNLLDVIVASGEPTMRHIVIATVGCLMGIGGVNWTIVMRVIALLNKRSDEQLSQDDAVGITNGNHLVVPSDDGTDGVLVYDLRNGTRFKGALPPPMVSTIYSVNAIWAHAESVLTKK